MKSHIVGINKVKVFKGKLNIDNSLTPTNQLTAINGYDRYCWKPIPADEVAASARLSNGMYIVIGKNLAAADIYRDDTLTELISMEHGFTLSPMSRNNAVQAIIALTETYIDELGK